MLTTERLLSGGVMANYRCTAACRHCLYSCSPERADGYITEETAKAAGALLRSAGCRSVHIGGGEPFLDFDGLLMLVRILTDAGVWIDYIETNAYWASDRKQCEASLRELMGAGADTLCISIDPFHAEYVPTGLPLSLAETCQSVGFQYFLWQEKYLSVMAQLDRDRTHSREEMERLISPQYILATAKSYGLHYGGRAIGIEAENSSCKPVSSIIDNHPCRNLLSGSHFHVDMFGRYIPPGCTGIAIPLSEAVSGIPDSKYPVFEALLTGGIGSLLDYAISKGFIPDIKGYPSSCALCFHMRGWLSANSPSPELDYEHYVEALRYW